MSTEETGPCKACKQPIRLGATRCHHCSSAQAYLPRYLESAGAIISILAATASAVFFLLGWIQVQSRPAAASLQAHVLAASEDRLSVLAVNTGRRAGAIASARLIVPSELERVFRTPAVRLRVPEEAVVHPAAVVHMNLEADQLLPTMVNIAEDGYEFKIELRVLQATGDFSTYLVSFRGRVSGPRDP